MLSRPESIEFQLRHRTKETMNVSPMFQSFIGDACNVRGRTTHSDTDCKEWRRIKDSFNRTHTAMASKGRVARLVTSKSAQSALQSSSLEWTTDIPRFQTKKLLSVFVSDSGV
jgi:hypothetical protein